MAFRIVLPLLLAFHEMKLGYAQAAFYTGPTQISSYLLTNYDKFLHPGQLQGSSTQVEVSVGIIHVEAIDDKAQTVSLITEIEANWRDQRLAYDHLNYSSHVRYVPYTNTVASGWEVWKPDLHWRVCDKVKTTGYYYHVFPNGEVKFNEQLRILCRCDFQYGRMPWNKQQCHLPMSAFGQDTRTISFRGGSLWVARKISLPKFDEFEFRAGTSEYEAAGGDRFSRMVLTMNFEPKAAGIITSVVVPVIIFVFIAWGSMWIVEHPPRMALGIMSALIVNIIIGKVYDDLPSTSLKPWIVDFLYGCLFFNLTAAFLAITQDFSDHMVKAAKEAQRDLGKGMYRLFVKIHRFGPVTIRLIFLVSFVIYLIVMFSIVDTFPQDFGELDWPDLPGTYIEIPKA